MKFGSVPVAEVAGAILAHSVDLDGRRLRKGQKLTQKHAEELRLSGHEQVVVARLGPDDCHEDDAATRIAHALVPDPEAAGIRLTPAFTGRVNLLATEPGVVILDRDRLSALNLVDPMITVATVPEYQQMRAGGMIGTVKIISYGVADTAVVRACLDGKGAVSLARPVLRESTLIITEIPGGPGDKGQKAITDRVAALDLDTVEVLRVPHQEAALAEALARARGELVLILTGSATSDAADVGPAALRRAGGHVERFGMPVDPGNLLFLGVLGTRPVIGLPGCARSPALNGADWVLARVACGVPPTSADIAAMGVGGLLKEIPTRPQPRRGP